MSWWKSEEFSPRSLIPPLVPLALWALLLLSLQAESIEQIINPASAESFFNGFRSVFPLLAAFLATTMLVFKAWKARPGAFVVFSPLTLTGVYGLAGLVAALLSPNLGVAAYWAVAYLSVPLVLVASTWGDEGLATIHRIVRINWLIVVLSVIVLFVIALLYLDLWAVFYTPSIWFRCPLYGSFREDSWFDMTSGILRPTGVARYAAIGGIIALGGFWQRQGKLLWSVIMLISMVLLMTSGARGSMVGFIMAAPCVLLLHGGKKAIKWGAVALMVLVPFFWATGLHADYLETCFYRTFANPPVQTAPSAPPATSEGPAIDPLAASEGPASDPSASSEVSAEVSALGPSATFPSPTPGLPDAGNITDGVKTAPEPTPAAITKRSRFSLAGRVSGRDKVWADGLKVIQDSVALGRGFQSDRLILKTHIHNSYLQALIQAGVIGAIPFVAALLFGWFLLIKVLLNRAKLPPVHRHMVVQVAGVAVFLTLRTPFESTGAFFGVDWLILAPLLLYLHALNQYRPSWEQAI